MDRGPEFLSLISRDVYTATDERVAVEERSFWGSSVAMTLRDLDGLVLREYLDSSSDTVMTDGFESGDLACWPAVEGGLPVGGVCPKPGLTWRQGSIYRDGQLLASELPQPTGRVFHYLNHQGTPVRIGDGNGNIIPGEGDFFFPFGESHQLSESAPLSPLRYTGHYRDRNGLPEVWDDLDQMHARYFGAHFGRFTRPDPIVAANPRFPQSWNQYAYAFDSPVTFVDRYGLEGEGFFAMTVDVIDEYINAPRLLSGDLLSLLALGAGRGWSAGPSGATGGMPVPDDAQSPSDEECGLLDRFVEADSLVLPEFPLQVALEGGAGASGSLRFASDAEGNLYGSLFFGYGGGGSFSLTMRSKLLATKYGEGQGFGFVATGGGGLGSIPRFLGKGWLQLLGGRATAFKPILGSGHGFITGEPGIVRGLSGLVGVGFHRKLLSQAGSRCR